MDREKCGEKRRTVPRVLSSLIVYLTIGAIGLLAIPGLVLLAAIKIVWYGADKIVRLLDRY